MTRITILEQVISEVKLRVMLHESILEWDQSMEQWTNMDFSTLNIEELTAFIQKYNKNVATMEKGLPENEILRKLSHELRTMQEKLPTISNLRNPNLKQRHWLKIEGILNYKV